MVGKVYISNFGRENYAWPECLKRSCIATMNDVQAQKFWEAGDREGFIADQMSRKTWSGIYPNRGTASRWFNLMSIISESEGDLWIHSDTDALWWTISKPDAPYYEQMMEPVGLRGEVVVCFKPCRPWSSLDSRGHRLEWKALHAYSQQFLFTYSTLQQLSPDFAAYARALLAGEDLSVWHNRPEWTKREAARGNGAAIIFNDRERAVWRMVDAVKNTVKAANGQTVERVVKNKDLVISEAELKAHIDQLITKQDALCALSQLPLQFDGTHTDHQMLCSLDRIDSNGHYGPGNLQVVCKFINAWKSNSDDGEFRRLIGILKSPDPESCLVEQR